MKLPNLGVSWLVAALALVTAASAEDIQFISAGVAGEQAAPCECEECDAGCGILGEFEDCPQTEWMAFSGFDAWRGVADGSFINNSGMHTGLNAGGPLPGWDDSGLAWQLGGSFGVYDWNGRESSFFDELSRAQRQLMFTAGVFRRANADTPWSWGVVTDQMVNDNFGVFSTEPYLVQLRYQVAYATSSWNEIGFWGTTPLNRSQQLLLGVIPIETRGVGQANLFWHHKFDFAADSWLYFGLPTTDRVSGDGTLGNFLFGGTITAPLSDRLAVYGGFTYLNPTAPAVIASEEDSFNVTIGIAWYPGSNAVSRTVAGRQWLPYLPVANNGSFLVDQNFTF